MSHLEDQLILDYETWTPLMCATFEQNFDRIRKLVENGTDIFATSQNGNTILHVACMYSVEAFELYKKCFTPNIQNKGGISPLMILAVSQCHARNYMVQSLLQKGADVNLRDYQNKTALIHAIEHEREDIAMELDKDYKLNWDVMDNFGNTPLSIALAQENNQLADYISSRIQHRYKTLSNNAMAIPITKNENVYNPMNTFSYLKS